MNDADSIIEGFLAYLEVLRESGARQVEIDRSLLAPTSAPGFAASAAAPARTKQPVATAAPAAQRVGVPSAAHGEALMAFLHDGALSQRGGEMLNKIVSALGGADGAMPLVTDGALPDVPSYIVLGAKALKKWFPQFAAAAPGSFATDAGKRRVFVTYSPEYILRFPVVTPAVEKIKRSMWSGIKSAWKETKGGRR